MNYLSKKLALEIDQKLINNSGIDLISWIEIAGYNVSITINHIIKKTLKLNKINNIMIFCGKGNNGNDGIVAVKYIKQYFDCKVNLYFFSEIINENTKKLLNCSSNYGVDYQIILEKDEKKFDELIKKEIEIKKPDFFIDSLLGFSFKPPLKFPYLNIINILKNNEEKVFSIDLPSGWDADGEHKNDFIPNYNISLMVPKKSLENYSKSHFLTGNFLPENIRKEYNIKKYDFEEPFIKLN